MTTIIGIDPGSRITGYGIVQLQGQTPHYVASGCIIVTDEVSFTARLQKIFNRLSEIMLLHQPQSAAIEQVFLHTNPAAALKLGQARGAAIAALPIEIAEYSAKQVKQSVVGYGAADKKQIQHMVSQLLKIADKLQADEADGLAVALCHAFHLHGMAKFPGLYATKSLRIRRTMRRRKL